MLHKNKIKVTSQDAFARHLVSEIRKYFDSEEVRAAFEEWLKQQEASQDA